MYSRTLHHNTNAIGCRFVQDTSSTVFAHYQEANVRYWLILKGLGNLSRDLYGIGDTKTN